MKILVVGPQEELNEFEQKFGGTHELIQEEHISVVEELNNYDAVFDFNIAEQPEDFGFYASQKDLKVFVNAPKMSLAELAFFQDEVSCHLFGFNGMKTFINREILEVSSLSDPKLLKETCEELSTDFEIVQDRVGMVTPRIICMIINEAYYTVQEGTSSREDIDKGMKLGTNYPYGPFEWMEKIGLNNVYELLEALYEDTKEERYKICPLLKSEYLKN